MHIDEDILREVQDLTGASSKTRAVEIALKDLARRHRLRQTLQAGLGLTPSQWSAEAATAARQLADKPSIDPVLADEFIESLRVRQQFSTAVAEEKDRPPRA